VIDGEAGSGSIVPFVAANFIGCPQYYSSAAVAVTYNEMASLVVGIPRVGTKINLLKPIGIYDSSGLYVGDTSQYNATGPAAGAVLMSLDGVGHEVWGNGQIVHSITFMTNGGTENLIDNNYNIFDVAGHTPIVATTINIPNGIKNNDVIELKFNAAVTTITLGTGTVVNFPTSATAGAYYKFVWDSTNADWN
jgi:hypothetical protein